MSKSDVNIKTNIFIFNFQKNAEFSGNYSRWQNLQPNKRIHTLWSGLK